MLRRVAIAVVTCLLILGAALLTAANDDYPYAGNTETYKFHRQSCRYFNCKNCTARFKTRDEALAAGYRPCGVCDP